MSVERKRKKASSSKEWAHSGMRQTRACPLLFGLTAVRHMETVHELGRERERGERERERCV